MPPVAAFAVAHPFITAGVAAATAAGAVSAAQTGQAQKQQKSAQEAAQAFANQQMEEAKTEQARLEEKYGLTPGELERESRVFELEVERQTELSRRVGLTGEELLREAGPETTKLLEDIARRQGMTGEELFRAEGELPRVLQEQILAEAREPEKFFQDTLQQELELVRQQVNQEAQRRGVFGGLPEGGIRFEMLGRAGVELAIKSAKEKQAARQQALSNAYQLSTQFQELSAIARGEAGTVGERSIQAQERARAELDTLLTNIQNLTAGARQREAGVAIGAAGISSAEKREAAQGIQEIYGIQAGQAAARERAGLETIGGIAETATKVGLEKAFPKEPSPFEDYYSELLKEKRRKGTIRGIQEEVGATSLSDISKYYPY